MQAYGPYFPLLSNRDLGTTSRSLIDTLSKEVASGRVSDLGRALDSDFSAVSRAAHGLRVIDAKRHSLSEAETWTGTMQTVLASIEASGGRIMEKIGSAFSSGDPLQIDVLAEIGRGAFADMTSALTTTLGGRAVFANGDPDGAPLTDPEGILADIEGLAATSPDVEAFLAGVDDYFASGGSFHIANLASLPEDAVGFPIGEGAAIDVPIDLSDDGIVAALKQAALVAALPHTGFAIDQLQADRLSTALLERSATASDAVVNTQGRLGGIEERISVKLDDLAAEDTELQLSLSNGTTADPYETATRLQNEMNRLETIYALTARRSALRITDYL